MKFQDLFEMPEQIAQQEVTMPWASVDAKTKVWSIALHGVPGGILACHPLKTNKHQQAIVAYAQTERGKQAVGGMLVHVSKSAGRQCVEVSGLTVSKSFRGKGLATNMYITLVFDKGLTVVSDDVQTPGDSGIWRRLAQQFPEHIGVTDGEVDEAVPVGNWTDGDPFTNHFTRLILSPTAFAKKNKAA